MESLDQSAFMTTYTGRRFILFAPTPDMVDIHDIAHALSQLCRFTGHCQRFYSVAEHCWHTSHQVPAPFALEGLLHDATEAYINDLSRPLKHHPQMQGYVDAEHTIDAVVRAKFGLPATPSPEVKVVDNTMVCTEAVQLMTESTWAHGHPKYGFRLVGWPPAEAKARFLARFHQLTT